MAETTGTAVPAWLPPETLKALDDWRESQMAPPTRSRAIAAIVAQWLDDHAKPLRTKVSNR